MSLLQILYLYPNEMNFYGDTGNVITLQKRLAWRGLKSEMQYHHVGQPFRHKPDIIVGGGGQDSGQLKIYQDLLRIGGDLRSLAQDGVPMLMVCGMYQLFGNNFITSDGQELPGISVFAIETLADSRRLIGNIRIQTPFGELIGFENHSGQTRLCGGQAPLGSVLNGYGNNSTDKHEGAICNNVIGTYLHGPLLPRNPLLADHLLTVALQRVQRKLPKLPADYDDTLAQKSHEHMLKHIKS